MRPIRSYAGSIRTGRAIVVHALVAVTGFTLGALTGHFAVAMAATVATTLAAHLADRLRQERRTDSVERRYRTLVEELPLITYIDTPFSADESAAYVSPQVHDILGYTVEEWQAFPNFFVDHLHPADRKSVRERQRAARESGEPL